MKLRTKISVLLGVMVFLSVLIVGGMYSVETQSLVEKQAVNGLTTSVELAGSDLGGTIGGYTDMIRAASSDYILSHSKSGEEKFARISELAEDYGFTSGNILDEHGISYSDGTDFSDREYVSEALAGNVNISDITLSKLTGKYGFSVASPYYAENGTILGVIYFRMDIDFMLHIIDSMSVSENSYAYIVDADGKIIVHSDDSKINTVNIVDENPSMAEVIQNITEGNGGYISYSENGETMNCAYQPIENTNGWGLLVVQPRTDYSNALDRVIRALTILEVVILVIAILIGNAFAGTILKKTNRIVSVVTKFAKGDFSEQIGKARGKDELCVLQNATDSLQSTVKQIIQEENRVLGSMANYDLTQPDMQHYEGEFDKLANSVNVIKHMLTEMIAQVQEASSQVGIGSREIADATENMSVGTLAQANSIQQVSDDINNIMDRIRKNFENEEMVQQKLESLDALIQKGNSEMTDLVSIVKGVNEMSSDIQKIVGTIESIAFQTNILALNAEVEAARAGENGKGFAVVADEVGNLAARTTQASEQTAELIKRCIDGIEKAMSNADETFQCLGEVVQNSAEIATAFREISEDTREQAQKSESIQTELGNISDVVQTSTATAEETAAATEQLSGQAQSMGELIQRFRL